MSERDRRILKSTIKKNRHIPTAKRNEIWKQLINKDVSKYACLREIKKLGYKFCKVNLIFRNLNFCKFYI